MDERWGSSSISDSDGEWLSGRTGHGPECRQFVTPLCHELSDQSDARMISDGWLSLFPCDKECDEGPGLAWPHILVGPSSRQTRKVNGWGEMESCVESVQLYRVFTRHGPWLGPGIPSVHTLTDIPRTGSQSQLTPDVCSDHVSTSAVSQCCRVPCRGSAQAPGAIKQCLFTLWLITLKVYSVSVNKSYWAMVLVLLKWCLFWAQTTKEWFKRVSVRQFYGNIRSHAVEKWLLIGPYFQAQIWMVKCFLPKFFSSKTSFNSSVVWQYDSASAKIQLLVC